jgi:copper chaperone CopZ
MGLRSMIRGLLFVAALVVIVLAAANRQAIVEAGDSALAPERAAVRSQQASPPSEARAAGKEVAGGETAAGETQTRRLKVENILQAGGFGCVSCQQVVEEILRDSRGVESVAYDPQSDTYLVEVNDDFRLDRVARRVRSVSEEYNPRLGLPDSKPWVLKEAAEGDGGVSG